MAKSKKNLPPEVIRWLRKAQRFLMKEPKRFNMYEGVRPADIVEGQIDQPPCGTACCIAGALYVIKTGLILDPLNPQNLGWSTIYDEMRELGLGGSLGERLFYIQGLHTHQSAGTTAWPKFYGDAYLAATTSLQRALIGVARIEHYIATDGAE
jgi:hypothetical protein